jgi:hypothetical protein
MEIPNASKISHPINFEEGDYHVPIKQMTFENIRKARASALQTADYTKLVSPGKYKFTSDDKQLSKSNTSSLFKNQWGETLLTRMFFSKTNVENIQKLVRFHVYKNTGFKIDNQSNNEVLIVMRSIFLEYSRHPKLPTENMSEESKRKLLQRYSDEVKNLNERVVNWIVPEVASQTKQYIDYLRDSSEQPYYMERPVNNSIAGQRQYRSTTQVLLGTEL